MGYRVFGGVTVKRGAWYIILMLIFSLTITGCIDEEPIEAYGSDYAVYFANNEMTGHVPVYIDLESEDETDQVNSILNLLKSGLDDPSIKTTIPEAVKIIEVSISEKQAKINFSRAYTDMSSNSPVVEIICRSSIVKSLTGLDYIDSVLFEIEGIPLKDSDGSIIGAMDNNDIIMDIRDEDLSNEETELIIYYADNQGEFLRALTKRVVIDSDLGYEHTILNLLIEGPEEDYLTGTIPEGTQVKDIYTKDGVCYVDLSEAFVTSHMGGSAGETMTIYSIVNSLAERPNISKVQFLIEGEIRETYKGHFEFNIQFEPNWDLVD